MPDDKEHHVKFIVSEGESGKRLDVYLASRNVFSTRSQVRRVIDNQKVWVNDRHVKPGYGLQRGDVILVIKEPPHKYDVLAENIPLDIVYEDQHILVVNKPAGMVVHPAVGNPHGTLVNALLFHCIDLSGIGGVMRPGIVHRLDKDTSGLIVIAKSDEAHIGLAKQFKNHQVKKIYQVLVHGNVVDNHGVVALSIGRHPKNRKKMSTQSKAGRAALSRWRVVERYGSITLLDVQIDTGRTHQIRVHLNAVGHSVVGDLVYGNSRKKVAAIEDERVRKALKSLSRQALHAGVLAISHPVSGLQLEFTAPLPDDIASLCETLKKLS